MKKVTFLVPTLRGGGAERVVSRLTSYLARSNSISVATWDDTSRAYDFGGSLISLNLPAKGSYPLKAVQLIRRAHSIAQYCNTNAVDKVCSFMESASIPLLLAKPLLNRHVRLTIAIRIAPRFFGPLTSLVIRNLYQMADSIVMQTNQGKEDAVSIWGFDKDKCHVIPNPLDSSLLSPTPSFTSRKEGLIVAIGRLEQQKRFDLLLNAFSRLPTNIAQQLVILGSGAKMDELKELSVKLGVSNRVQFLGHLADPTIWLDQCSLFVLSSDFEGFPNALAEAMARGCPIVCTNCDTGPREMIQDGISGLLTPINDASALTKSINYMLEHKAFARSCGIEARRKSEDWTIDQIAPMWLCH